MNKFLLAVGVALVVFPSPAIFGDPVKQFVIPFDADAARQGQKECAAALKCDVEITNSNVWEWCGDRHTDEQTGELRDLVMRGGSWRSGAFHCTAVAHDPGAPQTQADNIGFRVAFRFERQP